jgi:hypothetical protein
LNEQWEAETTTSFGRRLKRIEATFQVNLALGAERHSAMQGLALQHLSREGLIALRGIVAQGKQPGQYTERESEVVKVLTTAFEEEVRKAGYATVREFNWSCGIEC